MAEYIEREDLIKRLKLSINSWSADCNSNAPAMVLAYRDILNRVEHIRPADVVPRIIIFDLESKLHTMLPFKAHPIPIDGKCTSNSYELGKEHVIYDILNYLGELEKKYTKGE